MIIVDYGNVEMMIDLEMGGVYIVYISLFVLFIYVGNKVISLKEGGKLLDLVLIMLVLLDLDILVDMLG